MQAWIGVALASNFPNTVYIGGNNVMVTVSTNNENTNAMFSIIVIDAATGQELWKVKRPGYGKGESPDTYSSAFIWEGQGGPLLVTHGNDYCTGHKLENGEEV